MSDLYSINARFTADDTDFQSKINSVVKGLDNFGSSFDKMTMDTKRSFAQLANQFVAIDQKAKLWGDSVGTVAQKQKVLKDEINRLIDGGMKIESKQIQDLKKSFDELGKATDGVGKKGKISFADMRDVMQGPVAAGKLIIDTIGKIAAVVDDLTESYKTQEKAETQLEAAALNNPLLTSSSVAALKDYASALQGVSTTGDETILPFMAQLASAGRTQDEIMRIMKTALDIAASGTMSLDSAVRNLNKTYGGYAGELDESMPDIKSLTQEELKQGKAVEVLAAKYAGMSEQVAKNIGSAEQLANAFGDLKEELGAPFEKAITPIRAFFTEIISGLADAAKSRREFEEGKTAVESGSATASQYVDTLAGEEKKLDALKRQLAVNQQLLDAGQSAMGRARVSKTAVEGEVKALNEKIAAQEKYIASLKTEAEARRVQEESAAREAATAAASQARNKATVDWIVTTTAERNKAIEKIDLQAKAEGKLATDESRLAVEQEKLNVFMSSYVKLVGDSGGLVIENNQAAINLLETIRLMTDEYVAHVAEFEDAKKAAKARADLEMSLNEKTAEAFRRAKTREKETALAYSKARGRSAQELTDISLKFDNQILESFQKTKNEELNAAIEAARKIGASDAALADLRKLYEGEVTEFAQEQARERLETVKDLNSDIEDTEKSTAENILRFIENTAAVINATISAASAKASEMYQKQVDTLNKQIEDITDAIEGAKTSIENAYTELSDIAEAEFKASTEAINRSFDEQKAYAETTYAAMIKAAIESGDVHKASILEVERTAELAEIERRRQAELSAAEIIKQSKQAEYERTTAMQNASTEIEERTIEEMESVRKAYEDKVATITTSYETEYTAAKESYDAQIQAAMDAGEYQRAEALQTERAAVLSEIEKRKASALEEAAKVKIATDAEIQKRKIAEETTEAARLEEEKRRLETEKSAIEATDAAQKAAAEMGKQFIGMALDITKFVTSGFTDIESLISAVSTALQIAFQGDEEKAERFMVALEKVVNLIAMIAVPVFSAMAEILLMVFEALAVVNDGFVEFGKFVDWLDEKTSKPIYFEDIASAIGDLADVMADFGGNVMTGFINGIVNFGSTIWDAVSGVFEAFVDGVKDFFGIHSPSTLFKDFGGNIIQGMIDGILSVGAGMWNAVKGVFEGLWGHIQNVFKGAMDFGKSIGKAIVDGANTLIEAGKDFVEDPVGSTQAFVEKTAEKAENFAETAGGVVALGYDMANQALKSTDAGRFVADTTQNVADAVGSGVNSAASFVGNTASNIASGLGKLKFWATGTNFAPGGLSIVGEQGPELVNLPRGSQVTPAQRTEQLLAGNNKSVVVNANFHSPKAMNQMEQMRALKDFERELAFQGVV